jgi:membrane glycosyltransferase
MDLRHPARVNTAPDWPGERHPNAHTAPPIVRGSMVPRPWRGFWNSIGTALVSTLLGWLPPREARRGGTDEPLAAWQHAARRRRAVLGLITLASVLLSTALFLHTRPPSSHPALEAVHMVLFVLLSTWIVTGFATALMGFWVQLRGDRHSLRAADVRDVPLPEDGRTAIIMPICNEDVDTVFAGLRATCESLMATGQARHFDVFVLSDSFKPGVAQAERQAWERLRAVLATQGTPVEVYYRLRQRRTHRKAGNVADFCRRWGRNYRYMIVLDADSVMSGRCLVSMVQLMEAHPDAGIIQTATQAVGHATLHARAQQFAARVTGRLFTLGMQFWQLGESHYWGHNAIIRVEPFMRHCALAPIPGRGGLAGSILSHDFVEAALMRRAGYKVWLVADLQGSYEQQPPDLISELQRDRRWCQGNLQNARLIAEPGLHRVHRFMFGVGAMSYLSAPLWLLFMVLGTALLVLDHAAGTGWRASLVERAGLWAWTLTLLFLPRVLGVIAVFLRREQRAFGGTAKLLRSALLESVLALLLAPVRMVAHSVFVVSALTGLRLEWKSPPREAAGVAWRDALAYYAPAMLGAAAVAATLALAAPSALPWSYPVLVPLLLAAPLTVATASVALGRQARQQGWLLIPEESWSPAVLRRAWKYA